MMRISTHRGYIVTIVGNLLFFVYLYILSNNLNKEDYSQHRYWFNASALISQIILFGLDNSLIKEIRKNGLTWTYGRSSITLICTSTILSLLIGFYFYSTEDQSASLMIIMALAWAISNYFLALLKTSTDAYTPIALNAIALRVIRIISVLPVIYLTIDVIHISIITLLGQLVYAALLATLFIQTTKYVNFAVTKELSFDGYINNFTTIIAVALLLKSDVLFSFLFNTLENYQYIDYTMIVILIFQIAHQLITRNNEVEHINGNSYRAMHDKKNTSTINYGVSLLCLTMIVAKIAESNQIINKELMLTYICITSGYMVYFSFGPTIERSNLRKSSSIPFFILASSVGFIFFLKIFLLKENMTVALAISMLFVAFRFGHLFFQNRLYHPKEISYGLWSIIFSVPFYLYYFTESYR